MLTTHSAIRRQVTVLLAEGATEVGNGCIRRRTTTILHNPVLGRPQLPNRVRLLTTSLANRPSTLPTVGLAYPFAKALNTNG